MESNNHWLNNSKLVLSLRCYLQRELNLKLSRISAVNVNNNILIYDNMESIPLKNRLIINYLN